MAFAGNSDSEDEDTKVHYHHQHHHYRHHHHNRHHRHLRHHHHQHHYHHQEQQDVDCRHRGSELVVSSDRSSYSDGGLLSISIGPSATF